MTAAQQQSSAAGRRRRAGVGAASRFRGYTIIIVLASFVVGYFIPFFLIQLVFLGRLNPVEMYGLLSASGQTAALVNLFSLACASFVALIAAWRVWIRSNFAVSAFSFTRSKTHLGSSGSEPERRSGRKVKVAVRLRRRKSKGKRSR